MLPAYGFPAPNSSMPQQQTSLGMGTIWDNQLQRLVAQSRKGSHLRLHRTLRHQPRVLTALQREDPDMSDWLTAAECAARTGLTVRALRDP